MHAQAVQGRLGVFGVEFWQYMCVTSLPQERTHSSLFRIGMPRLRVSFHVASKPVKDGRHQFRLYLVNPRLKNKEYLNLLEGPAREKQSNSRFHFKHCCHSWGGELTMSPFLSDRRHKTLTALNSDFLFLAVFGEHCMIKHNVCVCFLIKKSIFLL